MTKRSTTVWHSPLPAAIGLLLACAPATGHAADIMENIWDGAIGGYPSITVAPDNRVSITLPHEAVLGAGPEQIARVAKAFMDRWAPGLCSTVFDFQSPHKAMHVEVHVQDTVTQAAPGAPQSQRNPTVIGDVVFDYVPGRQVTCVIPGMVTS